MTHLQKYDGKLKHRQKSMTLALSLKTGRTPVACRQWLTRLRLGYRGYSPILVKSDWGYVLGEVYYTDNGRDKIAALSADMRAPIVRKNKDLQSAQ